MDITCYYLESTPGVEDPLHDQFLGCDWIDEFGSEISDGGSPNWDVGVHHGPPNQNSPACSASPEIVGDSFPYNGKTVTVTDINSVWWGSTNVGWIYLGDDGNKYAQANYATQPGFNFGVSIGVISIGASNPGGYSGMWQVGGVNKSSGYKAVKCFTQGSALG